MTIDPNGCNISIVPPDVGVGDPPPSFHLYYPSQKGEIVPVKFTKPDGTVTFEGAAIIDAEGRCDVAGQPVVEEDGGQIIIVNNLYTATCTYQV